MSSQQRQALAKKRLSQYVTYSYKELQAYSCILCETVVACLAIVYDARGPTW